MAYNIDFRQATSDAPACLTEYLNYLTTIKNRSQLTALNYYTDLRMFMRFLKVKNKLVDANEDFSEIKISDLDDKYIKAVTLTDAMEFLSFTVSERSNQAKARSRKAVSLRQFYKFLTNNKAWFAASPMLNLELPSPKNALPKHLTLQECGQLLHEGFKEFSSWMDYRDYAMIIMFLNCGMRLAELVGMDLGDIDLEQRQIRLFGKGHKERMVYLNDACVEALQLYLRKRNTMEGLSPKEKAVFITRMRKERISNRRVEQLISGAMKAAGLKGFSTHKLRHTAATLMYQTGNVDILTLKQLLGHSSVGTTQIYTHLQEFQVRAAIEQNPLGTVTPEKARLDTTKRAAGENRGENNADSMDVEEAASPMEAFEGAANDGIRVDISSMTGDADGDADKETV